MVFEKSAYSYYYFSFFLWVFPLLFIPLCKKNHKLLWIMVSAYLLRVGSMLIIKIFLSDFGPYVINDGYDDFELWAYKHFDSSIWHTFIKKLQLGAQAYTIFIIKTYQLIGQELWFLLLLNAFFGSLCVFFVYKIAELIYTPSSALKAALIIAIWPTNIYFSGFLLRDAFRAFLLVPATYFLLLFIKNKHFKISYLTYSFIFVTLSCAFHAASLGFGLIWIIIVLVEIARKIKLQKPSIQLSVFLFTIIFILFPGYYFYRISCHNSITNRFLSLLFMYQNAFIVFKGETQYLSNSLITNIKLFHLIPLHILYFLFYPFLWSIKFNNWKSVVGGLDAFLYLYFFLKAILCYRPWFCKRSLTLPMILLLMGSIIGPSLGVGNYGTAMRHRISFAPLLIAVFSYPLLNKKKGTINDE